MTIALIDRRLNELVSIQGILSKAMNYALLGPGKRIRSQLVLASASTFGIDRSSALDPACAIEMVHAYSLIHDDLPCMDNDDVRRGQPTVHRAFPEAIALLAGDALLTDAFCVLSNAKDLDEKVKIRLISTLSTRAGKEGMAGGQAIDILSIGLPISPDLLLEMHRKKTGDLLSCCLEFGAILGQVDEQTEKLMRQIGLHLGLAYQIRDDLEDAEHTKGEGFDEGKPTSLTILGYEKSQEILDLSLDKIKEGLSRLPAGAPQMEALLAPIFNRLSTQTT